MSQDPEEFNIRSNTCTSFSNTMKSCVTQYINRMPKHCGIASAGEGGGGGGGGGGAVDGREGDENVSFQLTFCAFVS